MLEKKKTSQGYQNKKEISLSTFSYLFWWFTVFIGNFFDFCVNLLTFAIPPIYSVSLGLPISPC